MPPKGGIPSGEATPETAKEKFERERLSRRQALKRLGMTSAMTAFALFSVDDLARMVGKAMQQRAGDNKVATQVAKELQDAGVVIADVPQSCSDCCSHRSDSHNNSFQAWCSCIGTAATAADFAVCDAAQHARDNDAQYAYSSPDGCYYTHCQPQGLHCPPLTIGACIQAVAN